MQENESSYITGGNVKWYLSSVSLLVTYQKEMKMCVRTKACPCIFIGVLFTNIPL